MDKKWYLRVCRRRNCQYAAFDSLEDIIKLTVTNPSYFKHIIEKRGYWYSNRYLVTSDIHQLTGNSSSMNYAVYGQSFNEFIKENGINYKNVITGETLIDVPIDNLPKEIVDGRLSFIARLSNKCTDVPFGEWLPFINDDLRELLPGELELIKLYSEKKKERKSLKYPRIGYVDSDNNAYLNLRDLKESHPGYIGKMASGTVKRVYPDPNEVLVNYETFIKLENKS